MDKTVYDVVISTNGKHHLKRDGAESTLCGRDVRIGWENLGTAYRREFRGCKICAGTTEAGSNRGTEDKIEQQNPLVSMENLEEQKINEWRVKKSKVFDPGTEHEIYQWEAKKRVSENRVTVFKSRDPHRVYNYITD